jgi:hypothetical protein
MRRAIITAALATALMAAPATIATPAFAAPAPTTAAIADSQFSATRAWEFAAEFDSDVACHVTGAAGVVAGKWRDWNCYYSEYSGKFNLWILV